MLGDDAFMDCVSVVLAFVKSPVKYNLTSLKRIGSGAAPVGKEVDRRMQ